VSTQPRSDHGAQIIKAVGHVALRVPDLEASVRHATQLLGLKEVERRGDHSYLTCDQRHHGLELVGGQAGLEHVALEIAPGRLDQLREVLQREGVRILSERPEEPALKAAIRFLGPSGQLFEVYDGIEALTESYNPVGVRPRKFGHLMLKVEDVEEMTGFLVRVLGFRISDSIVGDEIVWLRCNPDHHAVAVVRGPSGLHHYAWEVEGWPDLERLADALLANGETLFWGPGRHGPGNNLFSYHIDPAGAIVEYFCDLLRIDDEASYRALEWPNTANTLNRWGPQPPSDFIERGLPLASTVART
jgi:catechol 2,3-dioxygenase